MKYFYCLSLVFLSCFLMPAAIAQEVVYEQGHGVAFSKGDIDSDVLISIIQEKQEELNKFVLSRIVTKSWTEADKEDPNSRLNNFTSKYLIYEMLNGLTITADKSQFGKNAIESLKEASLLFGIAVTANTKFYENLVRLDMGLKRLNSNQTALDLDRAGDTIGFNQTLDMVLNVCITNPEIVPYFPVYGKLAGSGNSNRTWYENDSRYYNFRNDSAVAAEYARISELVDGLFDLIDTLKQLPDDTAAEQKDIEKKLMVQVSSIVVREWTNNPKHAAFVQRIERILNSAGVSSEFRQRLGQLVVTSSGQLRLKGGFPDSVRALSYDYATWQGAQAQPALDKGKLQALLSGLEQQALAEKPENGKAFRKMSEALLKQVNTNGLVSKEVVSDSLRGLMLTDEKWRTILSKPKYKTYIAPLESSVDRVMSELKLLEDRYSTVESTLKAILSGEKTGVLENYLFNRQQLEEMKKLMNRFIDYINNSGKFNTPAIFLRSMVDNITFSPADTSANSPRPATISLNFESLLYSVNDKLVAPSRLYRTRYFQLFLNIGVNYAGFLSANELYTSADGVPGTLKGMTFASEKIGFRYKIINRAYTRSFQPGVVYRYYGHDWSWNRPQQKSAIDDLFIDMHAGGLLYNAFNLNTEQNFSFPFAGIGLGARFFNGLTLSGSLNAPFTGNSFRKENLFVALSLDVPIVEYISALRSK